MRIAYRQLFTSTLPFDLRIIVDVTIAFLLLGALAGCDRERRESRGQPLPETALGVTRTTPFLAGVGSVVPRPDPRAEEYEGNSYHQSQGQLLYARFNCTGCHAHGGGGIGPALMDADWIYGGSIEQIVATLAQGRPNGMPSWANKLTEQQMWQVAAYVRSLSGNVPKDVPSSRGDTVSNIEPLTLKDEERARPAAPESDQ